MKRPPLAALALTAAALLAMSGCSEPQSAPAPKSSAVATTHSPETEQTLPEEESAEPTADPVEAAEPDASPTQSEDGELASQQAASPSTDEFSDQDLHRLQVLALTSVLEDSAQREEMCDAWQIMGDEATAIVINSEVEDPADRFPVEVVAEVFENSCT